MRKSIQILCLVLLTGSVANSYAADAKLTITIKRLSLEAATRIAQAAIAACRKEGVQVAVTVVDRGGHPQVVMRDVLAMDITLPISKKKAHSAMAFNSDLTQLVDQFKSNPHGAASIDEVIIAGGGIPINIGGNILGGIGVSGAPSALTDEKCAKAGLAAVKDDLELE